MLYHSRTYKYALHIIIILSYLIGSIAFPPSVYADSVITVATNADTISADGLCSLREAIVNANNDAQTYDDCVAGSGDDTVVFSNSLGTNTIVLGSTLPTIDDADGLTINGGGDITLSGNDFYRVMIVSSVSLTVDSLTIANGYCSSCLGAAIFSGGAQLTIKNSSFTDNRAESSLGGAIYDNDGSVDISNSTFSGSEALFGGAVSKSGNGTLSIADSTFSGNLSTSFAGGAVIYTASPTTISNSLFTNNHAPSGVGGVIYNDYVATLTITNSIFTNNSASLGGAIYNGVNNSTTATITHSTFSGNFATTENGGGDGGAIYISGWSTTSTGTVSIANSTFSGNTAPQYGGAIYNYHSLTTITNSTFSGNSAVVAGNDITHWSENNTLNLYNSILANAVSGENCYALDVDTVIGNNNLFELPDTYCGFIDGVNGNIVGSDPDLGTLTSSPAYFPLLTGSPAIDAGDNAICAAAPVNNESQNGVMRPNGTNCDIGSFEKIVAATFTDVPTNAFAWAHIESIYAAGITGGCSTVPLNYCPGGQVTRAQMAVFLLKGMNGSSYSPPPATGTVFNDVPTGSFAAAFIEAFSTAGITGGCGNGNFCPSGLVTRAQMAVFLLKAKHGASYTPPPASGTMFNDVPSNAFAAAWIEQLASEGITGGCGGGNYCPANPVTRAQMAVFLQKTFNLPLP